MQTLDSQSSTLHANPGQEMGGASLPQSWTKPSLAHSFPLSLWNSQNRLSLLSFVLRAMPGHYPESRHLATLMVIIIIYVYRRPFIGESYSISQTIINFLLQLGEPYCFARKGSSLNLQHIAGLSTYPNLPTLKA